MGVMEISSRDKIIPRVGDIGEIEIEYGPGFHPDHSKDHHWYWISVHPVSGDYMDVLSRCATMIASRLFQCRQCSGFYSSLWVDRGNNEGYYIDISLPSGASVLRIKLKPYK